MVNHAFAHRFSERFNLLSDVSQRITSILELEELLTQVAQLIQQTFKYYHVGIGLIEGEDVVYRVGSGALWDDPLFKFKPAHLKIGKEGISGCVADSGTPLLIPDVNRDPRYVWMQGSQTKSEMTVPIVVKGAVVGVLDVQSDQLNDFDETDLDFMQSLANQTGIAIENARLYKEARHRAEQFRVVTQVSQQITSILDINELLKRLVLLVQHTFDYYHIEIGLIEGDEIVFRVGAGELWEKEGFHAAPSHLKVGAEGIAGWVAAAGKPLIIPDVSKEPHYIPVEGCRTRSELTVPILVKDQVIGVMDVESDRLDDFHETDLELMTLLANQAGIAIENARSYSLAQHRAEQFQVLTEVSQQIISLTSVDELLKRIAQLVKESFGYIHVGIGLIKDNYVISKAEVGVFEAAYHAISIPLGEGIWGRVAQEGIPLLSKQVNEETKHKHMHNIGIHSHLCVPLKIKEKVIGVMSAASDHTEAFDQSDETILQSLANQVSVAIENARLYEKAKEVAALEERQRLSRELHDSVTQSLYGITLYSQAASGHLAAKNLEQVKKHLEDIGETSQEALAEMRLLIYQLRPPVLDKEGLLTALQARLSAVEGRAGLKTGLKADLAARLPFEMEEGLYHIAQEALNNTLKHSHAKTVTVLLKQNGPAVTLEIIDDGIGFDMAIAHQEGKMGLYDMEEHAVELGGRLTVVSGPGKGTRVSVEVNL